MSKINKFTFFRNYFEIIRYLKPEEKIKLYDAIFEYMFEDKEPELENLLKGIWINIKMPLDNSKKNIENGGKGGRPKTEEKPKDNPTINPKETQSITQTKANNISYFLFLISNNNYKYIYNNSNIYNKILEWLKYKEERKEIYKETGLKSLLSQIENQIDLYGEDKIVSLIGECMANNYKGIIFDKLKNKKQKSETIPNWFEKDIKEQQMTIEEQQEMKDLLKDFK